MLVYKNGDILTSTADVICHQVNCKGVMGAGLAKQIRNKYPNVYDHYKWHCETFGQTSGVKSSLLGNIILDFGKDIDSGKQIIASLFAQDGYGRDKRYTDYEALRKGLKCLSLFLGGHENTIAIPYQMGCGLGGGDWNVVLPIVEEELASYTIEVWKYNK